MIRREFMTMLGMGVTAACLGAQTPSQGQGNEFYPGRVWLDTDGQPINAHDGGMLYHHGVYYWFGEIMDAKAVIPQNHNVRITGMSCYSSRDLYHWKNEGIALSPKHNNSSGELGPNMYAERPKVIYNHRTKKFVMWLHVDDHYYHYAHAAVAVSDRPTGPYRYLGSCLPDGAQCRDMTLFQDTDGKAYLVFSSEENRTMHVAELTDDYLKFSGPATGLYIDQFREAPAVFKYQGRYFLITSHCAGWKPSAALYAVAPSMLGPWKEMGNPMVGPGADITYNTQGTYVLPVAGRPGAFIFMADRWKPDNLPDSRYIWLPITIQGDKLEIPWRDQWNLSVFK